MTEMLKSTRKIAFLKQLFVFLKEIGGCVCFKTADLAGCSRAPVWCRPWGLATDFRLQTCYGCRVAGFIC